MAMSAASDVLDPSVSPTSCALYAPLTENEVVSTCTCCALTPKIARAWLAIPANSLVGSWAYNQSSVRPRQSSLSISALIPAPSKCSTGLLAKYCGTKYNCRLLNPKPFRIIATIVFPRSPVDDSRVLDIQPRCKFDLLAHARHDSQ